MLSVPALRTVTILSQEVVHVRSIIRSCVLRSNVKKSTIRSIDCAPSARTLHSSRMLREDIARRLSFPCHLTRSCSCKDWRISQVTAQERPRTLIRAAQYVRMSTGHQRYSTYNQAQEIEKYADLRGMEIVRRFADDGMSGLNLEGRAGLLQLLEEVQDGTADFPAILVYDVSRWGRFQDADESGYWEYVCKRAGVAIIHYCAEQFANDGSLPSVILKSLKRTMAGEYSRELSVKVFAGHCRLIELGYPSTALLYSER